MKKILIAALALLLGPAARGQEASSAYNVLKLPANSHAAALGGENISNIEDVPAAGWSNPALLSAVSDNSVGLTFMTYNAGSVLAGAQYAKAFGERHTGAVMAQYLGYGSMDETDENGTVLGSFNPKDIIVGLGYSYLLSERWAGGASLKATHQNYGGYTSMAMSFDLGLNYFDEGRDFSLSVAARNVGAQLKALHESRTEHLPFSLQVGLTKGLDHIPVRLNVTLVDLTRWKNSDFFRPTGKDKISFGQKALNHVVLGLDILPTDFLYLAVGYNARRAYELKSAGSMKLAGLTCGAGLQLSRFKLGASFAKYHVGNSSLMFNLAYSFE